MMHAVVVSRAGGPEVLEYRTVPMPALKPGWTRIKVRGFGINHSEVFTREGLSPSVHFPRILGIEVVGTVDATTDPEHLASGQTVVSLMGEMGRAFDGSYAEYVLLPNAQVFPVTTGYSWAELAAVPETFYTAFGIFKSLQIKAGDRVLIRAVTSGVGVALVKLMRALPFAVTMVGTTRSARKAAALTALGVDELIVTPAANQLPDGVGQFDKISDLIGPAAVRDSLAHLREFGIVSSTGQLGGVWTLDGFDPITEIPNNRYLTGFYSGVVTAAALQELFDFLGQNHVDVTPEKIFTLPEIRAAHEYLAASQGLGKVVVVVAGAER